MTEPDHKTSAWGVKPPPDFDHALLEASAIGFDREKHPSSVTISGFCPFCGGATSGVRPLKLVPAMEGAVVGQAARTKRITLTVACACDGEHAGRPIGARGCGQHWVVELELKS